MDASSAQDAPRLRLVGRYQLVSPVISGALGELWRAKIASGPEEGRVVLVRLIPRTAAVDARAVERLTNAGFAAMELRHAKIAAVLDVVVADSEIAFVSEHPVGTVLQSVARATGPKRVHATPALALRVVADVLEALDAVREPWAEITADPGTDEERTLAVGIHGGLTPDNVLLATSGETMLLESGLAGVAMTLPAISDRPEVVAYRAPEQIDAKGPIDERADVFTAGILAWELVAGRPLFGPMLMPRPGAHAALGGPGAAGSAAKAKPLAEAAQTSSVKRKVLSAPVQRLDSLPLLKGKVTKELASWVARCLERDRAARYQTIREALTELYALGPKVIAAPEEVAKWVVASGVPLDLHPETTDAPPAPPHRAEGAPSAEPATTPGTRGPARSVKEPATAPPKAEHAVAASPSAAVTTLARSDSLLPDSSDIESVPPSGRAADGSDGSGGPGIAGGAGSTWSIPLSTDIESIPPSSGRESIPPSTDVESIPPSTDVESIPPSTDIESIRSGPGTESIPPSTDIESIPPGTESIPPSTDIESIPPRTQVDTDPPSSDDAMTLPPARPNPGGVDGGGLHIAAQGAPPAVGSFGALSDEMMAESESPFGVESTMLSRVPGESAGGRRGAHTDALPGFPVHPVTITSAPMDPGAAARTPEDEPESEARLERGAARRVANRKVVTYVVAGAAALVLLGLLRVLLSGHDSSKDAGPQTSASAETVVVTRSPAEPGGPAQPGEPNAEPTNPLPSPAGNARALPTSAPSPAAVDPGASPPSGAAKKPTGPKKKPFRPTGI